MSFDHLFDLTAGVYFHFYNMIPQNQEDTRRVQTIGKKIHGGRYNDGHRLRDRASVTDRPGINDTWYIALTSMRALCRGCNDENFSRIFCFTALCAFVEFY